MFTISKQIMLNNNALVTIAKKIRSSRLSRNLTIQQLADRTSLSKGLLSKIENAKTIPSLPVFISLVEALDISLKDFFSDMLMFSGKAYLLVRPAEFSTLERESGRAFLYKHIISGHIPASWMQVVLLTIPPGSRSTPSTTDALELKYVLSGTCDYLIGEEVVTLQTGDVLYFNGSTPHAPVNRSSADSTMLVIYLLNNG